MSYLRTLPVAEVKIDRTFVGALGHDDRDGVIVGSVIELAHRLGLRAVAEGVESPAALVALEALGCDLVQGYELARPMRGPELEAWMTDRGVNGVTVATQSLEDLRSRSFEQVA